MGQNAVWTLEEVETLKAMLSAGQPYEKIRIALGRTYVSCQKKASDLGISGKSGRGRPAQVWTPQQINILRDGREQDPPLTYVAIARQVGKSTEAVTAKAVALGLHKPMMAPAAPRDAQARLAMATYQRLVTGGMSDAQARFEARKAHGMDGVNVASAAAMCADEQSGGV